MCEPLGASHRWDNVVLKVKQTWELLAILPSALISYKLLDYVTFVLRDSKETPERQNDWPIREQASSHLWPRAAHFLQKILDELFFPSKRWMNDQDDAQPQSCLVYAAIHPGRCEVGGLVDGWHTWMLKSLSFGAFKRSWHLHDFNGSDLTAILHSPPLWWSYHDHEISTL